MIKLATFLLVPLVAVACSAASPDGEHVDETTQAASSGSCKIKRDEILASVSGARKKTIERALTWWDAQVPYSQAKYHKGYRTDCSGFVSMCWGTGTSYTTASFINGGGKSHVLKDGFSALIPGDAIVRHSGGSNGHIVLFLGWNDAKKSAACVLEQASTALDMEFRARTVSSLKSGGYKAIRSDKLKDEPAVDAGEDAGVPIEEESDAGEASEDVDSPEGPEEMPEPGTEAEGDLDEG